MKTIIFLILFFFLLVSPVVAATPTEEPEITSAPTDESRANSLSEQISDLKDKIASRVAQLNLVDKRGMIGTVKEVKSTQIIILDPQQKTRIIDIDGITKFSSPSAKSSFGISDVTVGSTINAIGLYNKQSRRILARFIDVGTLPTFVNGTVTDVDKKNFTFTVIDVNNTETTVDVENVTRTNTYTKENEMVKTGFSKITAGDRVIVTGSPDDEEKNRLTGLRVLILPEVPKNPSVSFTPELEDTAPAGRISPTP